MFRVAKSGVNLYKTALQSMVQSADVARRYVNVRLRALSMTVHVVMGIFWAKGYVNTRLCFTNVAKLVKKAKGWNLCD